MEWWLSLSILLAMMLLLFAAGLPIGFSLLVANLIALFVWAGGVSSFFMVVSNTVSILNSFVLVPVALFILMGQILFRSGIVRIVIDALDNWIGNLPGRLSLLCVVTGTILATISGSSVASAATLGSILVPEMRARNYSTQMIIGPIMGSGILAALIPPSSMAVFLGAIAGLSIAHFLIAIVVPGLLLASLYFIYILIRTMAQPALAPPYRGRPVPLLERILSLRHSIPLVFLIFLVTGVIFFGIATPSEASALGVLGAIILTIAYRKLSLGMLKKATMDSVHITTAIFVILMNANVFSQVLAYTGATRGLIGLATNLPVSPIVLLIFMNLIVFILCCLMDNFAVLLISISIFMPVVRALGIDPVWFCVVILVNIELGFITPPFGLVLFVTKSVVPEVSMGDIYHAAIPFCLIGVVCLGLLLAFPFFSLWLPGLM